MTDSGRRRAALPLAACIAITVLAMLPVAFAHAGPVTRHRPTQATASADDELLARYAPVVAVREQPTECESGEPYLPMSVDDLFEVPGLTLRGPDGEVVDAPTPRRTRRVAPGDEWHIDIPGNALSPGCSYEHLYDAVGAAPITYGRVVTDPDTSRLGRRPVLVLLHLQRLERPPRG